MPQDANGLFIVGRLTRDAESRMIGENTVHDFRLAFTTREKRDGVWIDASNYIGEVLILFFGIIVLAYGVMFAWSNRGDL